MNKFYIGPSFLGQKFLIFHAFVLASAVRMGLSIFSYPHFRLILNKAGPIIGVKHFPSRSPARDQLATAMIRACRYIPGATCLTQAIAGQLFLGWHGYPATIRIGVTKRGLANDQYHAHAWLESDDNIILGESDISYEELAFF